MAAVRRLVVGWANKSVEALEHVLGVKKNIKTLLGNLTGKPAKFRCNREKWNFFLLTAVTSESDIGHANKLAEVVQHVLGMKKHFCSFGKLGREPLQRRSQKSDTPKIATLRLHLEPGNRPRAQTLLFLEKARFELFKMSGESAYLGGLGRKLCWKNKNGQNIRAGLYVVFNSANLELLTLP